MFEASRIEHVIFDVDGTLYDKSIEYKPGRGSIQTAHDFFRFLAWQHLKESGSADEVALALVKEYKERAAVAGALSQRVEKIREDLKSEFLQKVEQHGSNGKVFVNEFRLDSGYLNGELLQHIEFGSILPRDPKLRDLFLTLKERGYGLGILTTEAYQTVVAVANALGFDLGMFSMPTGDHFPILCSENVKNKKPSPDGFLRLIDIYKTRDPKAIVYVGDHFGKDVEAALKVGLQAVHVTTGVKDIEYVSVMVDGTTREYAKIRNICVLEQILRRSSKSLSLP